jgi:hypothetical protein
MAKTDSGAALHFKLKGSLYAALETWRRQQEEIPNRSEAVRTLLERALEQRDAAPAQ